MSEAIDDEKVKQAMRDVHAAYDNTDSKTQRKMMEEMGKIPPAFKTMKKLVKSNRLKKSGVLKAVANSKTILKSVESKRLKKDGNWGKFSEYVALESTEAGGKYCKECKKHVTQMTKCTTGMYHIDTWDDM